MNTGYHHVDLTTVSIGKAADDICRWLAGDPELNEYEEFEAQPPQSCVLNGAGSRESKAQGIERETMRLLVAVLRKTNPECAHLKEIKPLHLSP